MQTVRKAVLAGRAAQATQRPAKRPAPRKPVRARPKRSGGVPA